MAKTTKSIDKLDGLQVLKAAFNEVDASITNGGFLVGKVGRKVEVETTGDTEVYSFIEDGELLYELTLIYTDGTRETLLSAERTA